MSPTRQPPKSPTQEKVFESLLVHIDKLSSDDITVQTDGVTRLVGWLQQMDASEAEESLDFLVSYQVDVKFAKFFHSEEEFLQVQSGCLWGFFASNAERYSPLIWKHEIAETCISQLSTSQLDRRVQICYILGNLAADNRTDADRLVARRVLHTIVDHAEAEKDKGPDAVKASYVSTLLWSINSFVKTMGSAIPTELLPRICDIFRTIFIIEETDLILEECCFGIVNLVQLPEAASLINVNSALCRKAIKLLKTFCTDLQSATIQLVGALTAQDDKNTSLLIKTGIFPTIGALLDHASLSEDACWVVANIGAGTPDQLEALINDPRILTTMVRLIKIDCENFTEDDCEGRTRECSLILAHAINRSKSDNLRKIIYAGGMSALCMASKYIQDPDTLTHILDAIWKLVMAGELDMIPIDGENVNIYLKLFEAANGWEVLEQLKNHDDEAIKEQTRSFDLVLGALTKAGNDDSEEPATPEDSPAPASPQKNANLSVQVVA